MTIKFGNDKLMLSAYRLKPLQKSAQKPLYCGIHAQRGFECGAIGGHWFCTAIFDGAD